MNHGFWTDLGLLAYQQAYDLQTSLVNRCRQTPEIGYVLLVEHPPVYTLGRRGGRDHICVGLDFLAQQGIELVHCERGGEITYHAPGQLVVYPVFSLRRHRLSVSEYVFLLEEAMLRTAADAGIIASRDERNHGIWVGDRKLGSIGIAIRHGVTFHGLALNVSPALEPFSWINPCGLTNTFMTSLEKEQGSWVAMEEVKKRIRNHLGSLLAVNLRQVAPVDLPVTSE